MSVQRLNRAITRPLLVLYGLGTVVGAGIYATIGEVVSIVGLYTPLSFLVAGLMAAFSAMSLAELSARYPKSAGEAVFVREAFQRPTLSAVVGLLVILSGIVSAATIVNGAVPYVQAFVALESHTIQVAMCLTLCLVASLGVGKSVTLAAVISVIEVLGLLLVIGAGAGELPNLAQRLEAAPAPDLGLLSAQVFSGALLAFYAFIGFEDMVNMAEEVIDPVKNMPRAIIAVLVIALVLYVLLALVLVSSMDLDQLSESPTPLATVFEEGSGLPAGMISLIAILAIINGGLVQVIMGARVLYGLSEQGSLPAAIGRLNSATKTPVLATVLVSAIVLFLALTGSLAGLAVGTSMLLLSVFFLVNLALLRIKARGPGPPGAPNYPRWVPMTGALCSAGLVLWRLLSHLG